MSDLTTRRFLLKKDDGFDFVLYFREGPKSDMKQNDNETLSTSTFACVEMGANYLSVYDVCVCTSLLLF